MTWGISIAQEKINRLCIKNPSQLPSGHLYWILTREIKRHAGQKQVYCDRYHKIGSVQEIIRKR